ncbi:hypothetical protein [Rhizobium leucaenae]|uniref:Uncharacterized protein n=1 Tax=Rhizobium leucaenae TaxID=29450 RepID=A0A7W6ZT91_9HYPH|nr:hypothetical protein [Rhizobium leucaenae]MBB4568342.1 hypothetical protein [Rhizobium leucaenae]MBB6300499.1 hypothetical protein [Rhizobium leucaenae]
MPEAHQILEKLRRLAGKDNRPVTIYNLDVDRLNLPDLFTGADLLARLRGISSRRAAKNYFIR